MRIILRYDAELKLGGNYRFVVAEKVDESGDRGKELFLGQCFMGPTHMQLLPWKYDGNVLGGGFVAAGGSAKYDSFGLCEEFGRDRPEDAAEAEQLLADVKAAVDAALTE